MKMELGAPPESVPRSVKGQLTVDCEYLKEARFPF